MNCNSDSNSLPFLTWCFFENITGVTGSDKFISSF